MSAPAVETIVLTGGEVRRLLTPAEAVDAVQAAFLAHAGGGSPAPGILGLYVADGGFHVKAAALRLGRHCCAVKINGNFPGNPARHGLPTIQGVLSLADADDGRVLAVMDSAELTALRTGAATGVAARWLARPDAASLAIYGAGRQALAQVQCLHAVRPLRLVYCYDLDRDAALRLAVAVRETIGVPASALDRDGMRSAAPGTDLIVTCTSAKRFFLAPEDVPRGAFIAAVGADAPAKQEIDPALLGAATVVTDITAQCAEIGELHHAIAAGAMRSQDVHAELAEVVAGARPGRTRGEEITLFDSTGTALQDVAAALVVYERAVTQGIGMRIDLRQ